MSDKRVIRFTASWCQPCKMLARILEDVQTEVPIEVIDIDENSELAIQFGVRGVPTMIMFDGNTEVKRISGLQSEKDITQWLNA